VKVQPHLIFAPYLKCIVSVTLVFSMGCKMGSASVTSNKA